MYVDGVLAGAHAGGYDPHRADERAHGDTPRSAQMNRPPVSGGGGQTRGAGTRVPPTGRRGARRARTRVTRATRRRLAAQSRANRLLASAGAYLSARDASLGVLAVHGHVGVESASGLAGGVAPSRAAQSRRDTFGVLARHIDLAGWRSQELGVLRESAPARCVFVHAGELPLEAARNARRGFHLRELPSGLPVARRAVSLRACCRTRTSRARSCCAPVTVVEQVRLLPLRTVHGAPIGGRESARP